MADRPADRLAAALADNGCDVAFGVPGGGPNLDVIGAMAANDIDFVLAHGETASAIMASVYGHLTGRLSAAVVTRGPGAASAVNGAAQATLDRHPLVLVTDTVPSASATRIPHQRLDQQAMLAAVCKASLTLGADGDVEPLALALGTAMAAPAGAIHVDYDASALSTNLVEFARTADARSAGGDRSDDATTSADPDAAERVKAHIAAARRPVVIVGLGAVSGQPNVLSAVLEAYGAPMLTTYQATGVLDSEHELAAGLFTNGASERDLLRRADLIVAIGLDMVEPIPAPWPYEAPVVSLAATPTADPYLPIAAEVIGSPVELASRLLGYETAATVDHDWDRDAGAQHRQSVRAELQSGGRIDDEQRIGPLELVEVAAAHAPGGLTTTVDAGAHFLAVMPFWQVAEPNRLLISNGLATMGFSVPAAIAAALARPGEPVLCFVGDGGLGMTLAELETIVRLELPITVVVFNDASLSLIQIKQQAAHGGSKVVSYHPSDFAAIALGMGMEGVRVGTRADLAQAFDQGWDRPRLIDAVIDPSPYPHLIKITRG